jgi:hypothetical protein
MGGAVEPDLKDGDTIIKRTEIPVLSCPSDRMSNQWRFQHPDEEEAQFSCYDDVGSSYHYNLHAISDTNIDPWMGGGAGWVMLGQALVKDTMGGQVSVLTMFHEDPMDWALNDNTQEIGNHGKFNKHACGYLDGHADYGTKDTSRWCGVGWATINPNWVYKSGSKKPIYYTVPRKNCNP